MAVDTPTIGAPDLGHYLRPLRRHTALILVCTAIGLIAGATYAALVRPSYTSVAKVLVQTDATSTGAAVTGGRTTSDVLNMDTETQIATSSEVAAKAQSLLHTTTTPSGLLSKVTVSVPPNTSILKISFQAHSTAAANAGAKAFAEAYLQNRVEMSQGYLNRQITAAKNQIKGDRQSLATDTRRVDSLPTASPAKQDALAQQTTDQATITHDNTALATLRSTVLHPGRIVAPAAPGGSGPNRTRAIAVLTGLAIGLLVGLLGAFIRERLAKRIRSIDDLERLGIPVIAEVAPRPGWKRGGRKQRARQEAIAQSRAHQRVAAAVGRGLSERGGSIYVAALSPRAVEHRISEPLANEMGRFGSTTEVILYDSTAAELEQSILGDDPITPEPLPTTEPTTRAEQAGLGWPTSDPQPAASLVRSTPTRVELAQVDHRPPPILRRVRLALGRARYVVLEGTDALADSEPYILGSLADVTVLVVEAGVTTRAQIADVVEQVEVTPSELLGAMLWRAPSRSEGADDPKPRKSSNVSVTRDAEHTGGSSRAR